MANHAHRSQGNWVGGCALAVAGMLLFGATGAQPQENPPAKPPAYRVVHAFTGGADGSDYDTLAPFDLGLIGDSRGNVYGTTPAGGDVTGGEFSPCGEFGCGVVYKLDANGKQTVLHAFTGPPDGSAPVLGLVRDQEGNLYGVTIFGGSAPMASGTVFKVSPNGTETVLYSFTGGPDGGLPWAGLVRGEDGDLYGTASSGGAPDCFGGGCGVVFKLDKTGKETVLYSFTGGEDGGRPLAGLIRDEEGNLFGTALFGGHFGQGVVFKLDPNGKETVLHSFAGANDGTAPTVGLARDEEGNLYGAANGGMFNWGVAYKVDHKGNFSVLHAFTGGAEGGVPQGRLLLAGGKLYGTNYYGGNIETDCYGCGVVFQLDRTGKETVLYSFIGGVAGWGPYGRLLEQEDGTLYGVTGFGGDFTMGVSSACPEGCGVVFRIKPAETGSGSVGP